MQRQKSEGTAWSGGAKHGKPRKAAKVSLHTRVLRKGLHVPATRTLTTRGEGEPTKAETLTLNLAPTLTLAPTPTPTLTLTLGLEEERPAAAH